MENVQYPVSISAINKTKIYKGASDCNFIAEHQQWKSHRELSYIQ